jgi:acetolactate synthase-1/2/3 large subunit
VVGAAPTAAQTDAALRLLATARRPVIVAGGGVLFSKSAAALTRFAQATGIPVFANNKALGVLPADHPLSGHSLANLFMLGAMGDGGPDVALFLGARFGMFTRSERILPPDCKLIQVDIDAREFGRLRHVDIGIGADCQETLTAFNAAAPGRRWPDFSPWAQRVHAASRWHEQAYAQAHSTAAETVHPYVAVREIMAALDPETIVCADGGEASQWAELVARPRRPGQFCGHGYLGCLGIGMPFAIGAQVAHPDKRVVCIVGDGAAGLNIQEFDTMVRHNLPVLTIVLNNKAWGMCVHGQQAMYGANRLVVTTLGSGRYDRVAEGFGCWGTYVDTAEDVRRAVTQALATKRPACINIMTDIDAVFGATQARPATKTQPAGPKDEITMPYYDSLKKPS